MSNGRRPDTKLYSYDDSYNVISVQHQHRHSVPFRRGDDHFHTWQGAADHACTTARHKESEAAFRVRDLKIALARAEKELKWAKEKLANAHANCREGKYDE